MFKIERKSQIKVLNIEMKTKFILIEGHGLEDNVNENARKGGCHLKEKKRQEIIYYVDIMGNQWISEGLQSQVGCAGVLLKYGDEILSLFGENYELIKLKK
jgi:N-acetylneuraminic acid mutarotase